MKNYSLFTENMNILTKYSRKIDTATANYKDLKAVKDLQENIFNQYKAGYFNRVKYELLESIAREIEKEIENIIELNHKIKEIERQITADRRRNGEPA